MTAGRRGQGAAAYHGPAKLMIGDRLRRWRLEQNITVATLAKEMKVSTSSIAGWEAGASIPDVLRVSVLVRLLGHTITELMEGVPYDPD